MIIEPFGVRGSYPTPGSSTIKYGGNTTCYSISKEVDGQIKRIIIDSGSGIISLGKEIIGNFFAKKEELNISIFFTHLHPDHTEGFSFFAPNYFKGAELKLYGMETLGKHIEHALKDRMAPPTFPIEYSDLKSNREHIIIKGGDIVNINSEKDRIDTIVFEVEVMQAYAPSHPQQGALYYKITDVDEDEKIACIWDNESHIGGDKAVINFVEDCDVMIHDTMYTQEEYESNKVIVQGFGHSTYNMAIENARHAGVKKLICTHFNPVHSDEKLDEISEELSSISNLNIILAQEGKKMEI